MSACVPLLDPDIAFVLLAAGRSERFGGDKLVVHFKGKPLWRWAVDAAEEAGFCNRYVVIGSHSSVKAPFGWSEVVNCDAERGMGTSIAAGVSAAQHHKRLVIGLADMPMMSAAHLRRIASCGGTKFTRYDDDRSGCPAGFGRETFGRLLSLRDDRGARALALPTITIIEPTEPGILFDIDTPRDMSGGSIAMSQNVLPNGHRR